MKRLSNRRAGTPDWIEGRRSAMKIIRTLDELTAEMEPRLIRAENAYEQTLDAAKTAKRAYEQARDNYEQARAAYEQIKRKRSTDERARAERKRAWGDYRQALTTYERAWRAYQRALAANVRAWQDHRRAWLAYHERIVRKAQQAEEARKDTPQAERRDA